MKYALTEELLTKVLNYLATTPFAEVQGLIGEIQKTAEKVEEPKEE